MKNPQGDEVIYTIGKDDREIKIDGVDPLIRRKVVNTRLFQFEFRRNILNRFHNHCLFCDVDSDVLLEAAHIIPV